MYYDRCKALLNYQGTMCKISFNSCHLVCNLVCYLYAVCFLTCLYYKR